MSAERELIRQLEQMSDADIREMAEESDRVLEPIIDVITAGTEGVHACPMCGADAKWYRTGREWAVACESCRWSAAGMLSTSAVKPS